MGRGAPSTLAYLRARAIAHTFSETTLSRALARLGFVQADPIRAPAPAQDLILRHRVRGYALGDLGRHYARIDASEDYLYAYGFVSRDVANAIHPRPSHALTAIEKRVLSAVREIGDAHPNDVARVVGHARVTNAWGGQSRAATHALESLHYRGKLRVVRRDRGVRVYAIAPPHTPLPPGARLRALVLAIANVLAPVRERTLRANVTRFRHLGDPRAAIEALVKDGTLLRVHEDGEAYLDFHGRAREIPRIVRVLAPFDPLVWDRKRLEHLFGFAYRFEAYTPAHKRVRGYYAMPLLFGDAIIGWANVAKGEVDIGFATSRPKDKTFDRELEREIVRIRTFASKDEKTVKRS